MPEEGAVKLTHYRLGHVAGGSVVDPWSERGVIVVLSPRGIGIGGGVEPCSL